MSVFLHALGFGLVTAAILAIPTVAVTMQFSVTGIPNFAQGDIMTIGAYTAYVTSRVVNNLLIEGLLAAAVAGLVALLMNAWLLQPFIRAGAKTLILFVVTIGVSLVLQNLLLAIFGGAQVTFDIGVSPSHNVGPFIVTTQDEAIIVLGVGLMIMVYLVLKHTKFGKAQRAVGDDPDLARVCGINSPFVVNATWLWSGAMTGLAGFVFALQLGTLTPGVGFSFLLVILAAAVLGGIGQTYGAMLGAVLIGVATSISAAYLPADYSQSVAFLALILALMFRPNGLIPAASRRTAQL